MSVTHPTTWLRDEALKLMEGKGSILDAAREVTSALGRRGVEAPVVGGIAVVLHGHWRATRDIDLLAVSPLVDVATALQSAGYTHDPARKEFSRDGIPVHLVTLEQAGGVPRQVVEIEGVSTVSLADLVGMKLRSGTANLLRAQDLADVIALVRLHRLDGSFARHLDKTLRPTFRKIARSIEREG